MNLRTPSDSESRFSAYVEGLVSVIGHADRAGPLRDYCLGLMMPCERKSVEPMAAVTAPGRTAAQHQSLLHFVGSHHQAALAHRARLSGTQAGSRARTFRRARMARLPSPCHAVHRSLRIPDLRKGDDSPLRICFRHALPGTCHSRWLPTQRSRHCGLSATFRIPSRPCAGD